MPILALLKSRRNSTNPRYLEDAVEESGYQCHAKSPYARPVPLAFPLVGGVGLFSFIAMC